METLPFVLVPRANNFQNCTSDTCPVQDSIYGYLPSKPVNLALLVLFAIAFFTHLWRGIKWKSWTFLIALGVGSAMEVTGYIGRLNLHQDPFSRSAIGMQLVALTVAPAFIAGGIYLTLKHLVIIHGAKFSRIAPKWYTWIFISCDIVSILIQASGAGLESGGKNVDVGNDIMMVGIVSQVVTLAIFGLMAMDVFLRVRNDRAGLATSTSALRRSRRFRGFLAAIAIAYWAILIRCIYRIAEMAGGWRNPIMQNQVSFIIMDGIMCLIVVFVLAFCHPGFLFKESYAMLKAESVASMESHVEGTQSMEMT